MFLFTADKKEELVSLSTPGAVRLVCFSGQPVAIPEDQIDTIRLLEKIDFPIEDHDYLVDFGLGDEICVESGPLKGLKGFIAETRRNKSFVISFPQLQKSLSILDGNYLKKIDTCATN